MVRPEVKMSATSRAANVDALESAFSVLPDAYQRSLQLVEVVEEQRPRLIAAGTPVIRPMNAHSLGVMVDRHMSCLGWKPKAKEWQPCAAPDKLALLPMLHYGRWRAARPLWSVVESPFFRPDHTIWQTAGYDEGTGYLYRPNAVFPLVPENPSQGDAKNCLTSLRHVFCDFPYVSDAASIVPIACLLTILARAAIDGNVPIFLFEASVRGSGKTKQGDAVHVIATGRLPPHSTFPADEAEQRKELLAMALTAAPVAFLDNIKGLFGGAPLEAAVTSGEMRQRILGRTELAVVPWLATIIGTGNNMTPTEDILRRSLVSRVEPEVEDPTKGRTFQHHPLIPWVFAERERLIVAALTILRAYAVKGCPDAGTGKMESFDEWAALIPGAIVFAGGPNVLEAIGNVDDAGTDEAAAIVTLIRELPRLSAEPIRAKAILALLYPAPKAGEPPDGWDDLRTAIEALTNPRPGQAPTAKQLGDALRDHKGRVSGGKKLTPRKIHGDMHWAVEALTRASAP